MKFINLTTINGIKFRLNVDYIISYWKRGGNSEIQTTKEVNQVAESIEEIDNLLKELSA